MTDLFNHQTYLSPFTWRYGTEAMRNIWSVDYQRRLWRRIWVALAEAQSQAGLVTEEQVADLRAHKDDIDLSRAFEVETNLHHDLMAEVHTFAEQCQVGGGIIHLGATSTDIEDNADAFRQCESMDLILLGVEDVLRLLANSIEREAHHVCMAFTHLQPAEPTTVGYRLANYAQDLLAAYYVLQQIRRNIRGKGFKGAVGTSASYAELLRGTPFTPRDLEAQIMQSLGLGAFEVATQTYPRRQDWEVVSALAGLAMTSYKLAFDLRVLQSPPYGEWAEPFGKHQIGSSAMPFKRNPIHAENLDSLARFIAALPRVLWDNAAHSLLERTLDDSANRRVVLPEAFLASSELLIRLYRVLEGLRIDDNGIRRNLEIYGVFAATERLLMEAVRKGGNRQELHEVIRQHSLVAWDTLQQGKENPLADLLCADGRIITLVDGSTARTLLRAETHIGDAPERALNIAKQVREAIRS